MSKFKIALASLLIAGSLAAPVQASSPEETPSSVEDRNSNVGVEKFRVYVEANNKANKASLANQYEVRWELSENGFSTDMNEKQFQALQKIRTLP